VTQLPRSRQLRFDQLIAAWFIAITFLLEGAIIAVPTEAKVLLPTLPIADIPVVSADIAQIATPSGITAPRFIAIDLDSASVLLESRSSELQPPASVLKLLTALTALDFYKPDEVISLTEADVKPAYGANNELKWQAGEVIKISELLASLVIKSDNKTAEILAAHVPGGREAFLNAMQQKATQLSLNPTLKIINPSGLDEPGQLVSAHDLTWLGQVAHHNPTIAELMAQKNHLVTGKLGATTVTHALTNTNQLLWSELPILAGKTGTTGEAGEVLLTLFQVQNHPIMIVVMGSADRYADTRAIFNWIQTHYHWQSWSDSIYNGS
jgi:D-alanyl-D-alanine carboxypeptidase (penicillin-binding protein 5/6)